VCGVDDEDPVEDLPAQAAHPAFHDRVRSGCLDRCLDDPDALGMEYGIEGAGELGIPVADQEPELAGLAAEVKQEKLRACWVTHVAAGWAVTPSTWTRRVACSTTARQYNRANVMVSAWKKSTANMPAACALRNSLQLGPDRRGAGSMPAFFKVAHTVDGATLRPSPANSPVMRR
jgi:hypothetical protein